MAARQSLRGDRPMSREELSDAADIAAKSRMPRELAQLVSPFADVPALERKIARRPSRPDATLVLPPLRPAWAASTFRPKRAKLPPRARVRYRGIDLDPQYIWQPDDRKPYDDPRYPWQCVCRVLGRGKSSGVLVGPRHVLTASHCVNWSGANTVEVHRAGAKVLGTARAIAAWSYVQLTSDPGVTELDEDYAVLVLDQRLGDAFGWFGTRRYDSAWDDEPWWRNIGYPGDVAGGVFPIYQRDKELDEDEVDYGSARAMTTSADVKPGQSGGPVFAFWDGLPYVVAVVSAEGSVYASGDENWCSGGSDLPQLVKDARAGDP